MSRGVAFGTDQASAGDDKFFKSREEQTIETIGKVNRCRPGRGASCAFCCGSHNYTLSPERIEGLFIKRGYEGCGRPVRHPEDAAEQKLVQDGMQCPHVGVAASDKDLVSCLVYSDCDRGEKLQSFFTGTCKNFLCPAWDELTDREVLFAAGLMGDWYYYSLLINDIETLSNICAEYDNPDEFPIDRLEILKSELEERLHEEDVI